MLRLKIILTLLAFGISISACTKSTAQAGEYVWQSVAAKAEFPPSYNYPVFVMKGEMLALNKGGWLSKDGRTWTKTELPESGLNPAYLKYVQLGDAVYALGTIEGNYLNFKLSTRIMRTRDGRTWETLAEKSNLPHRIFYSAIAFKDKIWLFGGFDGKRYYNDIWNSADGVNWTRAAERAAWSPRMGSANVVFQDKIWRFGGGVIDGEKSDNPNSGKEVWTSIDAVTWTQVEIKAPRTPGGTPIVFDGKLWMIGANRNNGDFGSAVFVSSDGLDWREESAPWSPRGGSVVWTFGERLFMTGGKYSYQENGEIKFVYSNDVWAMSKAFKK
jgi:hypothetical protein